MLKKEEIFCLSFWKLNNKEKGMRYTFGAKNLTNKVRFMDLEVKLQENWWPAVYSNKNPNKLQN